MAILVGGVAELYQADLDAGRHLTDRLAGTLPAHVVVEDLHYGAVAVSQMMEDLRPDALVLIGATRRGGPPGTVTRRRVLGAEPPEPAAAQQAIQQATTGYVDIDLVLTVCAAFETLPARTVVVEIEPETTEGPCETLSAAVTAALDEAEQLIRREISLLPLMVLTDRITATVGDGRLARAPALEAMDELLAGIGILDRDGSWSTVFRSRDRLRRHIAGGGTGEGMDHLDWGLWWSLIEELDRLEQGDVATSR